MSESPAERPRDRLGRPLPWGSTGYPGVTMRPAITSDEAIADARAFLADGLPFHAHEILEMRWRCCPTEERELWRALAQAAAGATHAARGNPTGAQRLGERATAAVASYDGPMPDGIAHLLTDLSLTSLP